jgi:SSS family solute:Na+ symporter/sodium/pantothenate symporter
MLVVGFYARLSGVAVDAQDAVVREYLLQEFSGSAAGQYGLIFVFVALLAAGMSTLDGILVALSAMVVNDIVIPLTGDHDRGLAWSRYVLIAVGLLGLFLAWNPPPLIGLFAQKGVYGLAAASTVPLLFGVLLRRPLPVFLIGMSALIGLTVHLGLNLFGGVANPAVSASYAILMSLGFALLSLGMLRAGAVISRSKP